MRDWTTDDSEAVPEATADWSRADRLTDLRTVPAQLRKYGWKRPPGRVRRGG